MKNFPYYLLYFFVCAAFLVNAGFLAAELLAQARDRAWKKNPGPALLLAAALGCAFVFSGSVSPRGGYDNEHDFKYLSAVFFGAEHAPELLRDKEVSPLLTDALNEALAGRSLGNVLLKNRACMALSAVLLFACLLRLGLGLSAAFLGLALFSFNFLAALNGNTFSTTAPNVLYLLSAIYAAISFETDRRDLKGLAWALAALFLVWTGRYELAALPALLLASSLLRSGGALRELAARPGAKAAAAALLLLALFLSAAWGLLVLARGSYNGPSLGEALKVLPHLRYQLGDRNLGLLLPGAAGLTPYLAAAAFALTCRAAWLSKRRGRPAFCAVLLAWALYVSAVFKPLDLFPLHFMRHQLYFFIPFVFLAAAVWSAVWEKLAARPAAWAKWTVLAGFCALYLQANVRAARSLETELRTNDREWALLLKASEDWPGNCALIYPVRDTRYFLLRKYFPLEEGRGGSGASCCLKYLPPVYQVFSDADVLPGWSYRPASPSYAPPGGKAFLQASFSHRFYTIFGSETRKELPVRLGFYYADGPADRAWLLNRDGLGSLEYGVFGEAEKKFRRALALAPDCGG